MKRLFCILLCLVLLSAYACAVEPDSLESRLTDFMQKNGLDDSNFALSYFNAANAESYSFNASAFLPAGDVWALPLQMYYYEQEAFGAFDPPPEDPRAVYTIGGMTLEECRYQSILKNDANVLTKMREQIGSFRQYQLTVNECFGHCAEATLPDEFFHDTCYSTNFLLNCLKDISRQPEIYQELMANYSLIQKPNGIAGMEEDLTLVHIRGEQDGWTCDIGQISAAQPFLLACFVKDARADALLAEICALICSHVQEQSTKVPTAQPGRSDIHSTTDLSVDPPADEMPEQLRSWITTALLVLGVCALVVGVLAWWLKRRAREARENDYL